jgi:hypothetical protein
MEIAITDNKNVKEVQEEFQKKYPYLKIEFFKNTIKNGSSPSVKSQTIPGRTLIGMIRHIHTEGELNIDGSRSVEEIENDFQNKFGLSVQVFRKSSSMWIETTLTHHWSLLRQNFEGQQMS